MTTRVSMTCVVLMGLAACLALAADVAAVPSAPTPDAAFTIDPAQVGRTFTGFGGISGGGATSRLLVSYPEPIRGQLLDMLFTPGKGASVQILKVEIGGDAQSTDGTEPSHMHSKDDLNYHRGYEWWLMTEAKRRNPDIKLYGLPWAFPGWLGGDTRSPYAYPEVTAAYIVKWVQGAKTVYGLDIDYIDPGTKTTSDALKTGKPLWASEDMSTYNDLRGAGCWARILNQNHVNGNMTTTISWNIAASYYHGLKWFGTGLMSAAQPWSGAWGSENRNLGLMCVGSNSWGYGTAHTTYFTEAGWKYTKGGSGVGWLANGGSYVTLTDGTDVTVVVEKMSWAHSVCIRPPTPEFATAPEVATFQLPAAWAGRTLYLWESQFAWDGMTQGTSSYMQRQAPITVGADGTFSLSVSEDALYTITTVERDPLAPLPASAKSTPFPTQYKDDFDTYNVSSEASYFADQAGSWQIEQAADASHGLVMRQNVPERPICWSGDYSPYTVIGDVTWADATVTTDVFIESATGGAAFVVARTRICCTPDGVYFSIDATKQQWALSTNIQLATSTIAKGPLSVANDTWYTLSLTVTGSTATASVDGHVVAAAAQVGLGSGWVGFGTGVVGEAAATAAVGSEPAAATYVLAQFDNFQLSQASPQVCKTPAAGDGLVMAWCTEQYEANTGWDFNFAAGAAVSPLAKSGTISLRGSASPGLCVTVVPASAAIGASAAVAVQPCVTGDKYQLFDVTNSTYQPWATISNTDAGVALQVDDEPGAAMTVGPVAQGSQFMINELGNGHVSLYGPMVTDHCVAAGCPVTQHADVTRVEL